MVSSLVSARLVLVTYHVDGVGGGGGNDGNGSCGKGSGGGSGNGCGGDYVGDGAGWWQRATAGSNVGGVGCSKGVVTVAVAWRW